MPLRSNTPEPTATTEVPGTEANFITNTIPAVDLEATLTNISPAILEIGQLAQSGSSEEIILAYIASADLNFTPTAEDIVYLQDLGLSEKVITAVLNRAKELREQAAIAAVAPAPVETNTPVTNLPPAPPRNGETVATEVQPPAQEVTTTYFYDTLAPYGTWVNVPNYGVCWRPTVAVIDSGWRPYADRGRWIYTNYGWYWQSDYSWGWAPFHYGRWHSSPAYGWVWVPGTTWGPSWVSWRYSNDYCGWAPLPPEAHYHHGVGFTYHHSRVGFSFEFGLRDSYYTFVPINRFCDRDVHRHYVPRHHAHAIYGKTHVNNHYFQHHDVVVNKGIAPERVEAVTHRPVRPVAIRDVPRKGHARVDVVDRSSNTLYVHRPDVKPKNVKPSVHTGPSGGRGHQSFTHGDVGHGSKPGAVAGGRESATPRVGQSKPQPFSPVAPAEASGRQPPTPTRVGEAKPAQPGEPRREQAGEPGQRNKHEEHKHPQTRPGPGREGQQGSHFAPQLARPTTPAATPAQPAAPTAQPTTPGTGQATRPETRVGNVPFEPVRPRVTQPAAPQPVQSQPAARPISPSIAQPAVRPATPSVSQPQVPRFQQQVSQPKVQVTPQQRPISPPSVQRTYPTTPSWRAAESRPVAQPAAPVTPTFRGAPVAAPSAPGISRQPTPVVAAPPALRGAPVARPSAPPQQVQRSHQGGHGQAQGQMKKDR